MTDPIKNEPSLEELATETAEHSIGSQERTLFFQGDYAISCGNGKEYFYLLKDGDDVWFVHNNGFKTLIH